MEKKAAKKAVANKKTVEPKGIVPRSPWTELATSPVKKRASKESLLPEQATAAIKPTKAKKTSKNEAVAKPVSKPKTAAAKSVKAKKAVSEPAAVTTASAKAKKTLKKVSTPEATATGESAIKKAPKRSAKKTTLDVTAEIAVTEPKVELSPAFKALSEPKLPELQRENRARLMMQTPTKLYFYWSVRENPYQLLRRAFGDDMGSYTLVLKLTELNSGVEVINRAEAEGNWWFDVEPNGKYEAEIGFYAPNRPYFRVIYSNTIETPRRSPSTRVASDMDWSVSASKFAEVLDVAGFSQDAFDVAMAGDDHEAAESVTHTAFSRFIGRDDQDLRGIPAEDIRYTLMALASGLKIEELRSRISAGLFAILQSNAGEVSGRNAMNILTEYFDIDEAEFTEHKYGSAVYGASLVNFPRTLTTRRVAPKFAPVSSHSFR